MAEVPYGGVPTALPQTNAPDDYQRIQPTAFQGLAQFGQGASQAGQFFGQAAADDQTNNVMAGISKILYGDSTKTTLGPDGQSVPDTGFYGLKGRQALDARPNVESQINGLISSARGNLNTPEQQLQFDNFTRRYRTYLDEGIGRFTDQQSVSWYGDVNTASAQNAIDGITQSAGNPTAVASFTSDLINARVKQAQLAGAQPGDPVYTSAVMQAKAEGAKTQIMAIGANDPAKALRMINNYKGLLGTDYGTMLEHFQTKGDEATGRDFVHNYTTTQGPADVAAYSASPANPKNPVYTQVSSEMPGGMSPGALARTVQIESGGRDVTNASGHMGYGQFSAATWATYGNGGSPHNFGDSVAAIQRYAIDNGKYLASILGRQPTDAELYLAHQQGAGGAAQLLTHPNVPATSLVGMKAVLQNGGTADMTAAQYAAMWTHKFDGTTPGPDSGIAVPQGARSALAVSPTGPAGMESVPANGVPTSVDQVGTAAPATPAPLQVAGNDDNAPSPNPAPVPAAASDATGEVPTPLSAIYKAIDDSDMTPQQKQYAYAEAERQQREQAIAEDATAAQIKQANEAAMNRYTSQILQGQYPTMAQIANDNNLTAQGKDAMAGMMLKHADDSVSAASAAYGSGYWKAYQQVLAPAGDPSRISDPVDIYKLAAPGGPLTLAGAAKLVQIQGQVARSVDDAAVNTAKTSLLTYAKSKLSFDTTDMPNVPGMTPLKDPQGEMLFNSKFVPQFEAKFDAWVKAGNDPWKFLDPANVDGMISQLRNPREMALQKLEAQSSANGQAAMSSIAAPLGVDQEGWNAVMGIPTVSKTGQQWTPTMWAQAIGTLQQNPTPEMEAQFNEFFPNSPLDADGILQVLRPTAVSDQEAGNIRRINAGEAKSHDLDPQAETEEAAKTAPLTPQEALQQRAPAFELVPPPPEGVGP